MRSALADNATLARILDALQPLLATLAALAVGAGMLLLLEADPLEAYGALVATVFALNAPDLPTWMLIAAAMLFGFLGGALWGAIAGALKAYLNVNEILSTIMLNQIAVQSMNYLLRGPLIDPVQAAAASQIPQTARFAEVFDLPRWVPTRLHLGAALAILLAGLVYLFLWRT